jgi:hypothetical protein
MADFANKHRPLIKHLMPYFLYTLLPAGFFHKLASVGGLSFFIFLCVGFNVGKK